VFPVDLPLQIINPFHSFTLHKYIHAITLPGK
jgi:hypothetical protein